MRGWLAAAVVGALLLLAGGGLAQEHRWSDGDVEIVPVHPDLQFEDGAVTSSGDFFTQAVLRGEDADQVEEIAFSFGAGPPSPVHHPGYVGLWDYRVDANGDDGWFIPLTTSDTPDGQYKFAVHAYTSEGDPSSEIARLWGRGNVANEDGDQVGPWPSIQPGETARTDNPHGVQGVTIEFAENASARLFVDGREVALEEWTPPERDDDDIPRRTEESAVLGDGYRWNGDVEEGTVLRVEASDEANNTITKGALVGHGIDNAIVEVRLDNPGAGFQAGETSTLELEVANIGLREAEPALEAIAPEAWNTSLSTTPGTLAPGQSREARLVAEVPQGTSLEDAEVGVQASYPAGEANVTSSFSYSLTEQGRLDVGDGSTLEVVERAPADGGEQLDTQADPRADEEGVPVSPAASLVAFAVAGLGFELRRRDR